MTGCESGTLSQLSLREQDVKSLNAENKNVKLLNAHIFYVTSEYTHTCRTKW